MTDEPRDASPLQRLPTHVPGLDDLLGGGLFEGGVYFVQGLPGAGKTTLASHIAFEHARRGGRVLYVTLLAESHARMLQHLAAQSFYDASLVSREIAFISPFQQLEESGLKSMTTVVLREAIGQRATLMVFDGLVATSEGPATDQEMRLLVHSLQGFGMLHGCTTLLLTSNSERAQRAERTMVDGIFELADRAFGARVERRMRVAKFRGSAVLRGEHSFCISSDGIAVHPRLEAVLGARPRSSVRAADGPALPSGVDGLDALLPDGGLGRGTATLVAGASGTGRSMLAWAFAREATPEAPALVVALGDEESAALAQARRRGVDVDGLRARGALELRAGLGDERTLDQFGHELLRLVDERRFVRVAIDDLQALHDLPAWAERGERFLAALLDGLRERGVAVVATLDDAVSAAGRPPRSSGAFDNVILLHVGEAARPLDRTLRTVKIRAAALDPTPHSLSLAGGRPSIARAGDAEGTGAAADVSVDSASGRDTSR
ncbi:MAG TPA: ATPase domain-containing protein [Burkholderiaceae bacterium]|nr:ATPase domain-containing protein [Burkholderiaceae bacterium]